ncbi:hypothetical protein [Burkholderia thailandensis]|nr:hypothetical protein [Burkholderia thailandensis]
MDIITQNGSGLNVRGCWIAAPQGSEEEPSSDSSVVRLVDPVIR